MFELLVDIAEELVEGEGEIVGVAGDEVADAEEAGEADGGEGEDAEEDDGLIEIFYGAAEFENMADEDAEHDDLVLEVGEIVTIEVAEIGGAEGAGIEAVLEGVAVAGLTSSLATVWGFGGG
ncbi:MAG: hypothetical protein HPY59_05345 [Anaerolineae bacterium]|nr:hypothetical protein [Anaerolineae bacterium]